MLGQVGIFLADAGGGQPVEDAELALAQALVDDRLARLLGDAARLADRLGGLAGADIRRGEDDLGPLALRQRGEPAAERAACSLAELAQRHVDVAHVDVDHAEAGRIGGVARDVAGALPVADDPELFGPSLSHPHDKARARRKFRAGLRPPAAARRSSASVKRWAVHADRPRALDVDLPVVDEQGLGRPQAEAVEREIVDGRIGLEQFHLARDDDVAEAARRRHPPCARKGGQKSAEKLVIANSGTPRASSSSTMLVDARHRIADRLAEALAPGGDQRGISGEFLAELGRGLVERPAAVERVVPAAEVDILDEAQRAPRRRRSAGRGRIRDPSRRGRCRRRRRRRSACQVIAIHACRKTGP